MSDAPTVHAYKPGDEYGINTLFNSTFELQRSLEEWRWKFVASPVPRPELSVVAKHDGRIVGLYCCLVQRLQVGDRILRTAIPVDNAIDPAYRVGFRGLQYRIFREQERIWLGEQIPLAMGFPNKQAYVVGKRILKYLDLIPLSIWHKRLNLRLAARRLFRLPNKLERAAAIIGNKIYSVSLRMRPANSGIRITTSSRFPPEIDHFWQHFRNLYPVMFVRDAAYLNWRYAPEWGHSYRLWLAWHGKDIVGMAVGRIMDRGDERLGLILELAGLPSFAGAKALLRQILLWFTEHKVDGAIARMSSADPMQSLYQHFGFRLKPERFDRYYVYKVYIPEKVNIPLITDPKAWFTSLGDSDSV